MTMKEFDRWLGNRLYLYFLIAWLLMVLYVATNWDQLNAPVAFLIFYFVYLGFCGLEYIAFRIDKRVRYNSYRILFKEIES